MGRKPTVNLNLPAGMRVKRGAKDGTWYYLDTGRGADGKRHWHPLGSDFPEALRRYADRVQPYEAPAVTVAEVLSAWQAATLHERTPRTQQDIVGCIKRLLEFFGNPPAPLSAVEPQHIRKYLDWRKGKVQANREIAWLSAAWNWARGIGKTRLPNPAQGVKRNRETGRNIYVEDDELRAIMSYADEPLKEAMELAYLTGQRPCDLRGITETDIRDGAIVLEQDKTGMRLCIQVSGALADLIDRIRKRKRCISGVVSLSLLVKENGQALTQFMLRGRFSKARESAAKDAKNEIDASRIRGIQFRDLRAKAASDLENMERAQKLLGHTTQAMTQHYVRNRKGDWVPPVK